MVDNEEPRDLDSVARAQRSVGEVRAGRRLVRELARIELWEDAAGAVHVLPSGSDPDEANTVARALRLAADQLDRDRTAGLN